MSVFYVIIPLDEQTLEWAMDCGVPVQGLSSDGRLPTLEELTDVCGTRSKHSVRLDQREGTYDICVESVENVAFSYAGEFTFKNTIAPGIAECPATSGTFSGGILLDGTIKSLGYHGDIDLLITIIRKLTVTCGTQVFVVDCEGLPWIINSPTAVPIGSKPWAGPFPAVE